MQKFYLVTLILSLSLVMAACGENNNDVTTDSGQQDNSTGTQNDGAHTEDPPANTGDRTQKMESLEYIDFELSVSYNNDQDYEADLELDNNRVEAKIEDDLNGVEIEGDGAFDEVYPRVEQLTIDQNTAKEDVISQVLDAFDLSADYNEFELEIKFKDGTKKEYDDR